MVAKRRVLLGVEHLEHRRARVAAEVRAHLVDLVDHEQRVVGARVAQGPDDRAGHRADVRAPVAADLGLVAHAADADALEAAPERARDRASERGLADARRPDQAQDRAGRHVAAPPGQLANRQELEDAVLDLLDVVVVGVEHLARVREVEVVRRCACPTAAKRSTRGSCGSRRARRRPGAGAPGARARARSACGPPRGARPARAARAGPRPRPRTGHARRAPPGSP